MQQQDERGAVWLIVLLGLACGLTGIGWGLPSTQRVRLLGEDLQAIREQVSTHIAKPGPVVIAETGELDLPRMYRRYFLYSHHPDEMLTLAALAQMQPARLELNPRLFQYGGLFVYPVGAVLWAGGKLGLLEVWSELEPYLRNPDAFGRLYIAGRLFVLGCHVLAAVAGYFLARQWAGRCAATVASVLFLLSPAAVVFSHEMKPHAAAAVFVVVMFYWLLRWEQTRQRRWLWRASVACGAAAAMVPSNALFGVAVVAAAIGQRLRTVAAAVALGAGVYLVCNPYVLLDAETFLAELRHVHGWYQPGLRVAWAVDFAGQLWRAMGWPLIALGVGGWLVCARKHRQWAAWVLGTGLVYGAVLLWLQGPLAGNPKSARLLCPVLPVAAALAAPALEAIRHGWLRGAVAAVCLGWSAAVAWPELRALAADAGPASTRIRAGDWINANVPAGASIAVPPSPAPYKLPPFAFGRYRLVTEPAADAEWRLSVGCAEPQEGHEAVWQARGARCGGLSFANESVYVYRNIR